MPHGAAREILIDRFVIAAAPSLALAHASRRAAIAAQTRGRRDLRSGLHARRSPPDAARPAHAPNYRGAENSDHRLARLPYSAIEARAVVRAFAGADVIELAGFNATARRVIELPSADLGVLHFATHARSRARRARAIGAVPLRIRRRRVAAASRPADGRRHRAQRIARRRRRAERLRHRRRPRVARRRRARTHVRFPRQWLAHRGRLVVAGGRRAHGTFHGRVLRGLSGLRPRGRRAAYRAAAHAGHRAARPCGRVSSCAPTSCPSSGPAAD